MRLGFCTPYSEERVNLASHGTFDGIELFLMPGAPLDPGKVKDDEITEARDFLDEAGVEVLSVFHFENYADADKTKAKAARKNIARAMEITEALNASVLTCNAWVAGSAVEEKVASYKSIFGDIAKLANDRGVQVAIENCPHGGHNIANSPTMWQRMFDAVPSEAIGLQYDPSHLVWQGIDPIAPIHEFASRIYAFHAKDTQLDNEILKREGILGSGWWRYRVPGYGQVDWQRIFGALADIGYQGDVVIEHEDPVFENELFEQGLRLGLRHLRKFIA